MSPSNIDDFTYDPLCKKHRTKTIKFESISYNNALVNCSEINIGPFSLDVFNGGQLLYGEKINIFSNSLNVSKQSFLCFKSINPTTSNLIQSFLA